MVRHLKKVTYTVGDKIYEEGEFSEVLFMINKGTVKLYTYNGYAFAQYTNGEHFGDSEVFAGIDRIGQAQAATDLQLYKLVKSDVEQVLQDYPSVRHRLHSQSMKNSKQLLDKKVNVLRKMPVFGLEKKRAEAFKSIKKIQSTIKQKQEEFEQA